MALLKRFVADENGATGIEYGLIAAGIALAIITVLASHWHHHERQVRVDQQLIEIRTLAPRETRRPRAAHNALTSRS
jgi:hypothetical protein